MSEKRGRKNQYEEKVSPYFKDIKKWCRTCTEKQIAYKLGIGYSTFNRYKKDNKELRETLKKGRDELVEELHSALIKSAKGFKEEETKRYTKNKDGEVTEYNETSTKYFPPNIAALNLALKNYDENWANDPQMLELRKKELKLKEKAANKGEWDV